MAQAEDRDSLQSKRNAITALLPHAVWQERAGRPEMLDVILRAAGASRMLRFAWDRVNEFLSTMLSKASPRAVALVSPYIHWDGLRGRGDLIRRWAVMTSVALISSSRPHIIADDTAAPHTKEIVQSVVDALLQIASQGELIQYIPDDLWSCLIKCPPLPPTCWGRSEGARAHVVIAVRALEDIRVFKSYLLLVWAEWDYLWRDGLDEMRASIPEDFGGIGMGHHRTDLIQRLDHVLGQLDRGLRHLVSHNMEVSPYGVKKGKDQYQSLRKILLEMNTKAISRTHRLTITLPLCLLTPTPGGHRISRNIHMCTPPPVSIV